MSVPIPGRYILRAPAPNARIPVMSDPTGQPRMIAQAPDQCQLDVISTSGAWIEIRLPNGLIGYVAAAGIQLTPLAQTNLTSPRPHYATGSNAGTGTILLGSLVGMLSVFAIIAGLFLATSAQEVCPIDYGSSPPVNPYSAACTVTGYPGVAPGIILIIVGVLALVGSIAWVRRRLRRFS